MMHRFVRFMLRVLASRKFFVFVIALLVLQAAWVALSYRYPGLWDEYYHFGLIQYYGHHLNPIIHHQPASLDIYGNVQRSPKYLYHYLMSFPYRAIAAITSNQVAQIISLRFINIAMFAGGVIAFRQAMLYLTKSRAIIHFTLLLFVLLPLSSLLAAQINYDNLEFLLAGLVFLWTMHFLQSKRFDMQLLLLIIGGGLFASVVKYTFLPILFAIVVVLAIQLWRQHGSGIFKLVWESFRALSLRSMILLSLLVLVGLGLSVERLGVNLVEYHAIDPKCSRVLSVERCVQFSPFKQEYNFSQEKLASGAGLPHGPVGYTFTQWMPQLYDQYFTTGTQLSYEHFMVTGPLKIPYFTFLAVGAIGLACLAIDYRRMFVKPEVWIVVASGVILAAALWVVDYQKYTETGYPLAIQGRYLVLAVPLAMLVGMLAIRNVIRRRQIRLVLASAAFLGIVWGGGVFTHIILSQPNWYWQNSFVVTTNNDMRRVLEPVTY